MGLSCLQLLPPKSVHPYLPLLLNRCRHCHPALCWPNCDRPIPGLLYISETRLLLLSANFSRQQESRMGHRYRIAILVASLAVVLVAVRCRGLITWNFPLAYLWSIVWAWEICFVSETSTTGMYDADYRGPETHSSLPPPELPRTGTVRLSLRLPITRKLQS